MGAEQPLSAVSDQKIYSPCNGGSDNFCYKHNEVIPLAYQIIVDTLWSTETTSQLLIPVITYSRCPTTVVLVKPFYFVLASIIDFKRA